MAGEIERRQPQLPSTPAATLPVLSELTAKLGFPRDVLAGDDAIVHVWKSLPRLLSKIPQDKRSMLHVRMCVAVSVGLFDSALNYAWNSCVEELREKVRRFGLHVVPQIVQRTFSESELIDLKDAELLDLCLSLNLINRDDYFYLDQCRDQRNAFSAAHPPPSALDEDEVVAFVSRVARHALDSSQSPTGVDTKAFVAAVKSKEFTPDQVAEWSRRLRATHEAQRALLIVTLHGVYCDPRSDESARQNALVISQTFAQEFSEATKSQLIGRHSEYLAGGDEARQRASRTYFETLGQLELLGEHELHTVISEACRDLMSAHRGWNNFYNEPPFAKRLESLVSGAAVPATVQQEFVHALITCFVGNEYGVSHAAVPHYSAMIKNLSPKEIGVLLQAPKHASLMAVRMSMSDRCRARYQKAVELLNPDSIPTTLQPMYERAVSGKFIVPT